jgi:fibrillarin-like pre-rRNA processing protein
MKMGEIGEGWNVLYLGAATGTTVSHVSDIVGKDGAVFCVEFAPRPMKELLRISAERPNMVPIMADARRPSTYAQFVPEVDAIYQDVAQPNQSEIFRDNARAFLAPGGTGILMVKSRSVDVSKDPREVFQGEIDRLKGWGFGIPETITLMPFDKDHIAIVVKS